MTITTQAETTPRIVNHGTLDRDLTTGQFVETFTIRYTTTDAKGQPATHVRTLPAHGIETVGRVAMSCANRGVAWDIEVTDKDGNDVTDTFACFA